MALTSLSARLDALEDRLVALEAATALLSGVLVLGAGTALLALRRRARFSTLTVQRLQLVSPSSSWHAPDTLMAELSVRPGGRTELIMHGGAVLLTRADRSPALHLDGTWRPLARSEQAGAEGLAPLLGGPAVVMYGGERSAPLGALGGGSGWVSALVDSTHGEPAAQESAQLVVGEAVPQPQPVAAQQAMDGGAEHHSISHSAAPTRPAAPGRAPRAFDFGEKAPPK